MNSNKSIFKETEQPSPVPLQSAGTEAELAPPMCLRSHWDAGAILRWTLPDRHVDLPIDFRPYVKICKNYKTSAPAVPAPMPPEDMVFPDGGEFYPPGRYSANIDKESALHYLDRRLDRWCQTKEWVPSTQSDMFVPNVMVPNTGKYESPTPVMKELAMPQAILREHPYDCRSKNDAVLWNRSPRLFNNPTKQDRYGAQRFYALPGGVLEMPHGDAVPVPLTHQAIVGSSDVYIRRPGGDGYVGPIRPARDTNPDAPKVIRIQSMRTPGNWAPVPPTIQTTTPVATPPLRTSARTLGGF